MRGWVKDHHRGTNRERAKDGPAEIRGFSRGIKSDTAS